MQTKMFELNAEWKNEGLEYPFVTRIGINTGWCNVGNFGCPDRMAYTIIGGEVNLAARIESKCEPGGVLMSYETYALVKDHVEAEPREVVSLKGILRPVKTYAVNRLLNENDIKDETLEILLPNHEPLRIKSSQMTMPERLALIQELKYVTNKLEGNHND
jgi:class 3 adenylate cyclase